MTRTEFRPPVLSEPLSPLPLTEALSEVHEHYQRGQYSPAAIERVNVLIDVANDYRYGYDPIRDIFLGTTITGFQVRTLNVNLQGEYGPLSALNQFDEKKHPTKSRDLGFFYLHLSGLMAIGEDPAHGFAMPEPEMNDMLRSDYLYQRGLAHLHSSIEQENLRSEPLLGRAFEGMRAKRDKAEYDRRASVAVASRPFALANWEGFAQDPKTHFKRGERQLARNIIDDYKAQIAKDIEVGRMPEEVVFSKESPIAVFNTPPEPVENGVVFARGMIGSIRIF